MKTFQIFTHGISLVLFFIHFFYFSTYKSHLNPLSPSAEPVDSTSSPSIYCIRSIYIHHLWPIDERNEPKKCAMSDARARAR